MKKVLFLALALFAACQSQAQTEQGVEETPLSKQKSQWELAGGGAVRYDGRMGVGGHVKYVFPSKTPKTNLFTITYKFVHLPATDNRGFFNAFDADYSNNISGMYLMGGYRIDLSQKYNGRLLLDLNAGFGWVTRKSPALVINPTIQYCITGDNYKWWIYGGIVTSFSNWHDPNVFEVGLVYKFR